MFIISKYYYNHYSTSIIIILAIVIFLPRDPRRSRGGRAATAPKQRPTRQWHRGRGVSERNQGS